LPSSKCKNDFESENRFGADVFLAALQERRSMLRHYRGTVLSKLDGGGGDLTGGLGFGLEVGGYAIDNFVQRRLRAETGDGV